MFTIIIVGIIFTCILACNINVIEKKPFKFKKYIELNQICVKTPPPSPIINNNQNNEKIEDNYDFEDEWTPLNKV